MSAIRALERMLEAGLPLADALDIAKEFEAAIPDMIGSTARILAATGSGAKERKRAADRVRIAERRRVSKGTAKAEKVAEEVAEESRKSRATHSANVASTNATGATTRDMSPLAPTCERVVLPSLPSLPLEASEELNPPKKISSSPPAKPKRQKGSKRCPEDWEPSGAHSELARELKFTSEDASAELAKFRDHEFVKPKSDWDATFRTWLRNSAPGARYGRGSTGIDFATQRANAQHEAMEQGARIAAASGRRRWTLDGT